jgi:hypothetical protein
MVGWLAMPAMPCHAMPFHALSCFAHRIASLVIVCHRIARHRIASPRHLLTPRWCSRAGDCSSRTYLANLGNIVLTDMRTARAVDVFQKPPPLPLGNALDLDENMLLLLSLAGYQTSGINARPVMHCHALPCLSMPCHALPIASHRKSSFVIAPHRFASHRHFLCSSRTYLANLGYIALTDMPAARAVYLPECFRSCLCLLTSLHTWLGLPQFVTAVNAS